MWIVETDSQRRVFEQAFQDAGIDPAGRIGPHNTLGLGVEQAPAAGGQTVV